MSKKAFDIRKIRNLPEALFVQAGQHPYHAAQLRRKKGAYVPITYMELATRVRRLASHLLQQGIEPGDRIGILMENRPEWAVVDFATLSIGAVTVPLYCTYRPQDIAFVLNDAGVRYVFSSGGNLLRHLLEASKLCQKIERIYVVDEDVEHAGVIPAQPLIYEGNIDEEGIERRLQQLDRQTLATLVYTSGTTAKPKGVMLSHGNILANLDAVPDIITFERDDLFLSFLPLAHMLERTASHFLPYSFGISVAFAERPDTVAKNLIEAEPTIMITVPRMLEVVRNKILAQVRKQPQFSQRLFFFFLALSTTYVQTGQLPLHKRWLYRWLDRRIGQRIRDRFGGRLRLLVSGGAPLGIEVAEFFSALGIPVIEGYGLTECAPLLTVNPLDTPRPGSVGKAVSGVELRLADDGEILARGANIMLGYWQNPQATKDVIDDEGWFHTGDIGRLDEEGYLYITDRKKDIIVNSGGENIAPQRIEALLTADPMIDQAVIYGDQKPYLVALIVPNEEAVGQWARDQGLPQTDWSHLCASAVVRKMLQTHINGLLSQLTPFEQIRRIHVLDKPFGIDNGLLTPTLKIKRRKVYEAFREELESLYS
ncbi:MAG: long-chain fatty acid--CoA ligase [Zetaproteobacteria bacterium]|nr:MAG: long-chain fatty acid--CoA ligase [Zetaproteobacteria bacterium]